jgi:beta-glucosidase
MPRAKYFGGALKAALEAGEVPESRLNDMVLRVLRSVFASGVVDSPPLGNRSVNTVTSERLALARLLAAQSTVLLRNEENVLPLQPSLARPLRVCVCGRQGWDE